MIFSKYTRLRTRVDVLTILIPGPIAQRYLSPKDVAQVQVQVQVEVLTRDMQEADCVSGDLTAGISIFFYLLWCSRWLKNGNRTEICNFSALKPLKFVFILLKLLQCSLYYLGCWLAWLSWLFNIDDRVRPTDTKPHECKSLTKIKRQRGRREYIVKISFPAGIFTYKASWYYQK